jgi:hypothetical protein
MKWTPRHIVVSGCLLAVACSPYSGAVPDRETAIEIAKKMCKWKPDPSEPYARWRARLRGSEWHVWQTIDAGDASEPRCCDYNGSASLVIVIRADTGESKGCSVMVD